MSYTHTETNLPIENEYPKLVRDKVPTIVESQGKEVLVRFAKDDAELLGFLLKKLQEESTELANAVDSNHQKEELADVYEVLHALQLLLNVSDEELATIRKSKANHRGAFVERLIMLKKP